MSDTQTPTEASHALPLLAAKLEAIGPYRLREIIGEGGMGSVYRAEQTEPVWREVAIKVTRIDLGSAGSLARFEAERQILATLNHPNIAQVYEAGATPDGFPYMVMEYIAGQGLRQYCDERRFGLRERIGLFIDACRAVQYAHQRGVIHRDIKPSNILVDDRSGAPVPKLIDFDIAKLVAAAPGEHTVAGAVLGTPVYMSPEQVNAAADVDTRTDVYSLGVVLYQLLAGVLPRAEASGDARQWRDEVSTLAKRPSRKLADADNAADIAAARGMSLEALRHGLSSELDWIVLRAMAPERERRYGSAADLAADLQRYLDGHPVEARPVTRGYVLRKFIGRHRLETAFATLLLLAVGASLWVVVGAWHDERRAHEQAELSATQAKAINDFLLEMLSAPDPRVSGREVKVIDVLESAASKARDAFPDQPLVRAALLETLGRSYAGLAEQETAVGLIREALALRREATGADSELSLETENELNEAVVPLQPIADTTAQMKDLYQRAVPALGERHPVSITALNNYGTLLVYLAGETEDEAKAAAMREEALDAQRRNLVLREQVYGPDDERTTHARNNLAGTLRSLERYAEAEPLYAENLERQLRLFGEDNHYTLTTMDNLALTREQLGRVGEAMPMYQRSLDGLRRVDGIDHPATLQTQVTFGQALLAHGDRDRGIAMLTDVIEKNASRGEEHFLTRRARRSLADAGVDEPVPAEPAAGERSDTAAESGRAQESAN